VQVPDLGHPSQQLGAEVASKDLLGLGLRARKGGADCAAGGEMDMSVDETRKDGLAPSLQYLGTTRDRKAPRLSDRLDAVSLQENPGMRKRRVPGSVDESPALDQKRRGISESTVGKDRSDQNEQAQSQAGQ